MGEDLRRLIQSVTIENPSPADIHKFLSFCRAIAIVHLRKKISTGRLKPDLFAPSLEDLAVDCVAELFRTDARGTLIQVKTYFEGANMETLSDQEMLAFLRRLICGRVNQSMFRFYSEWDPSLGRILRNVKLAVGSSQQFTFVERFGELCIVPVLCETLECLPVFDLQQLDRLMRGEGVMPITRSIPVLLSRLCRLLRDQREKSRVVPVVTVALLFRALYSESIDIAVEGLSMQDTFLPAEVLTIIQDECRRVHQEMEPQYVRTKNIPSAVFAQYFTVINQYLCGMLLDRPEGPVSLFQSLRLLMPDLTREIYSRVHQSKLEYLARLTRERTIAQLREHYS